MNLHILASNVWRRLRLSSQLGAWSLANTGILRTWKTWANKNAQNSREFKKVGEPTRIFQFEKNQKGLKLWVVSREKASEVRFLANVKITSKTTGLLSAAHLWTHILGGWIWGNSRSLFRVTCHQPPLIFFAASLSWYWLLMATIFFAASPLWPCGTECMLLAPSPTGSRSWGSVAI